MKYSSQILNKLKGLLRPPEFTGDQDRTNRSRLLHQIAIISWSLPILGFFVGLQNSELRPIIFPSAIALVVVLVVLLFLINSGKTTAASVVVIGSLFLLFSYLNFRSSGEVRPYLLLTALVVVITGLLLGSRGLIIVSILMAFQNALIVTLRDNGILAPQENNPPVLQNIVVTSIGYLVIAFLIRLAIGRLESSLSQVRERELELEKLRTLLEKRVEERTQALETSSQISRRISSLLNKEQLAVEVVEQLKSAFNYYHAHIYLINEAGKNLVMTGGTGEAGKTLLERGHSIPLGKGLVGRAAASKEAVLVTDTSQNPDWLPNPLLPETKAEIAVPIIAGDKVLGVLDVQNNTASSLTEQDASLLRSIADQVAIALENIAATETVTKRAADLQKVSKVSAVTTALIDDEQELLAQVVHLTQREFGLYHAHVFLYDPAEQVLQIKACGWREGDEREGTHGERKIPLTQQQSLVARAARTRQPVIINDVRLEPDWLPNPLLPDTRSELAVPLVTGETLIGVLDIQSDITNAFGEEDAVIQSILASQITTALQNVRAFSQTRQQANQEALLSSISRKIQSTTTVESALQTTVRELGRVLGTQTRVQLKSTNGQQELDAAVEESRS